MTESAEEKRIRREGTVFYRRRIGDWLRRYIIELVILSLAIIFGIVTTVITANGRKVFREAKDVRYAIKAVGTEYYAGYKSIFDPTKVNGMADGAAEAIAELSTQNGQVFLYAWDEKENIPLKFEYRKGSYTVTYTADILTGKESEDGQVYQLMGTWNITYSFSVLKYESE